MRHAAARRLAALAALLALAIGVAADSSASSSSDYDVGQNATLIASLTANSAYAGAVFTSTNLCTGACPAALQNMTKAVSINGTCDLCISSACPRHGYQSHGVACLRVLTRQSSCCRRQRQLQHCGVEC